jgi:lipopolysaccharide transport system ATP-binding protein
MNISRLTIDEPRASVADFWPVVAAFLDLASANMLSSEYAHCTGVALCDEEGLSTLRFFQGQTAHFYYEFEAAQLIAVPIGGIEIHDALGRLVHGKNTFQYGTVAPESVEAGARLRFHHVIQLDIESGEYRFSVGLAATSSDQYRRYRDGTIADQVFRETTQELCRVMQVATFRVELDRADRLLHHGLANLPGNCQLSIIPRPTLAPTSGVAVAARRWVAEQWAGLHPIIGKRDNLVDHGHLAPAILDNGSAATQPAVFHITHWKAGSQWINKILMACAQERIVAPQVGEGQFLFWPLQPGKIYPTVYVTHQQFVAVKLPAAWRRFVVIRDLRDTLISAYFSLKISHAEEASNAVLRERLQLLNFEDGLAVLIDEWLPACARIQLSWQEMGERLIRYEDLLEHDLEILEPLLLDECELPLDRARFREIVMTNRFEQLTKGRARGEEDVTAHERKGIAGDWQNYFSDKVKHMFKNRYGGILIATGYERDFDW